MNEKIMLSEVIELLNMFDSENDTDKRHQLIIEARKKLGKISLGYMFKKIESVK